MGDASQKGNTPRPAAARADDGQSCILVDGGSQQPSRTTELDDAIESVVIRAERVQKLFAASQRVATGRPDEKDIGVGAMDQTESQIEPLGKAGRDGDDISGMRRVIDAADE